MDWKRHRALALALVVLAGVGLFAARRTAVEPHVAAPPPADAATGTLQPAAAALMALPEVAAWRTQAAQETGERARIGVEPGDSETKTVDQRVYRQWHVVREVNGAATTLQRFYVTDDGTRILVEDTLPGRTITLDEWRVKREAARASESGLKPLPPMPPVSG